jgi:hypothetical protein
MVVALPLTQARFTMRLKTCFSFLAYPKVRTGESLLALRAVLHTALVSFRPVVSDFVFAV